eukprot:2609300-Rhodomonas_salina.2
MPVKVTASQVAVVVAGAAWLALSPSGWALAALAGPEEEPGGRGIISLSLVLMMRTRFIRENGFDSHGPGGTPFVSP